MNAKYHQICKKNYNYSHAGNASAKRFLNLMERTQYISRLLKGKKREKIVTDDFLHQEEKDIYDDAYEKDDFSEDIFDKDYKNHHQQILEEQKSKYFDLQKSCSNFNSSDKKNGSFKDLSDYNQEKFKYHLLHHLHDLNCDDTIYKRIGNETSCASYNPKFEAIYRKIIFSPKFGKMSGRYDSEKMREIFEKKIEYNLQKKREQRLIEKMKRLKKIKKTFEMPDQNSEIINKSDIEKKTSVNKKILNSKRHRSVIGVRFQNNLLNSSTNNIINRNYKKSYSVNMNAINRDSIKSKNENETENEIIEEEDDLDSCRKTGDIMKELYTKSNQNANDSCKNIHNNGYYNELSTTNPKSSVPNLNQSMKNNKNTDLSYSNVNSINNCDTSDRHGNISINYMEKQNYAINNNNKNNNNDYRISRNNFRQSLKKNYNKIKSSSKNNNNSSLLYTNYKNRSCSNINSSSCSSKKKNILPIIECKNVVNFNKMLSRDYVNKVNSPPKQKIYTAITPNYNAIRPKEIMKVIYARKHYHKNKNKEFKSDFNEAIFDINKYYNNYNDHFPPKNIYFHKMTGKETSDDNPLPSYMIKQFDRNAINTINEKGLIMNSFANGGLRQIKSSFNDKKSFNYRLNEQYYNDNFKNLNDNIIENIINNAVRNENRKMNLSHSMCELNSNGKKRWRAFGHFRGTSDYYKMNLDDLGKCRERVDGITLKVNRSNVNLDELLTDAEKNIFLSDIKCS